MLTHETQKNVKKVLEQELQTRNSRSQEKHQPSDYERRRTSLTWHSEFSGNTYHLIDDKYVDIKEGTNKRLKNRVTVTSKSHPDLRP